MNVVKVPPQVFIVPYGVFPIAALPKTTFPFLLL